MKRLKSILDSNDSSEEEWQKIGTLFGELTLIIIICVLIGAIWYTAFPASEGLMNYINSVSQLLIAGLTGGGIIFVIFQLRFLIKDVKIAELSSKEAHEIAVETRLKTQLSTAFPELIALYDKFETGQALPKDKIPKLMGYTFLVDEPLSSNLSEYMMICYDDHIRKRGTEAGVTRMKELGPLINVQIIEEYSRLSKEYGKLVMTSSL